MRLWPYLLASLCLHWLLLPQAERLWRTPPPAPPRRGDSNARLRVQVRPRPVQPQLPPPSSPVASRSPAPWAPPARPHPAPPPRARPAPRPAPVARSPELPTSAPVPTRTPTPTAPSRPASDRPDFTPTPAPDPTPGDPNALASATPLPFDAEPADSPTPPRVIPERSATTRTGAPKKNSEPILSALGVKTSIELKLSIYPDARVEGQVVTSSGFPELDQAVLEDVKSWRWEPARSAGRPVLSEKLVTLKLEGN